MEQLSTFDKSLLNLLQENLPVCSHPFAKMAELLGSDESTVISGLRALKNAGYLRRIGTFFNSNNLGYNGTLIALQVEPEEIKTVAEVVNRYPGVTHNYEREGKYNLWFTLLTRDAGTETNILSKISSLPGVNEMLKLKSNKKYKVNVQFKLH